MSETNQSAAPSGRPGRYPRTTGGLIGSMIVLVLVVAGIEQFAHPVSWRFPSGAPWWAYFGGVLGVGFIAGAAWAVKEIGVLTFGLLTVAGQLGAALALDLLSAQTRGEVTGGLVAGVAITLAAAALAGYAAARST